MTDYENLQARCQRGEPSLSAANNLLAECRAAIGRLLAENERVETENEDFRTKAQDALAGQMHLTNERDLLKAELAGLRTGFDAQNEVIAELKKDAERLDWLDDQYLPVTEKHCMTAPEGDLVAYRWVVEDQSASVREAIDDAMGKGGEA